MKTVVRVVSLVLVMVVVVLNTGCATPQYQANQSAVNQGIAKAAIGAVIGAIAANNVQGLKDDSVAVILGSAALGGLSGAFDGSKQDQNRAAIGAVNEIASTIIINVNNSNGSVTPVTLRRVGHQYVGPRGEYYNTLPTEQQLKGPYGF